MAGEIEPGGLGLSEALEMLRAELEQARRTGAGREVQFGIDEVSLTLTLVAGRAKEAGAKVRWWVVEGGGSANFSRSETQTLVLTLRPVLADGGGGRVSLQVGAAEEREEL